MYNHVQTIFSKSELSDYLVKTLTCHVTQRTDTILVILHDCSITVLHDVNLLLCYLYHSNPH